MQKTFTNLELNGKAVDIDVADGRIASIVPAAEAGAATRPVAPAFYNCHTHLAMNLLRGYADDLELMPWLQEHIWPAEAHLTDEIVYAGTRLAILELIRSGTVNIAVTGTDQTAQFVVILGDLRFDPQSVFCRRTQFCQPEIIQMCCHSRSPYSPPSSETAAAAAPGLMYANAFVESTLPSAIM